MSGDGDPLDATRGAAASDAPDAPKPVDELDAALLDLDDEQAFEELRGLLVADERRDIERLEQALTGFLGAVIRDDTLEHLLRDMAGRAVEERLRALRDELPRRTAALLDEALERELSVRRGELPDRVGPIVDDAVADHIRLAERHAAAFLQPAFDEVMADLTAEARQRLVNELTPEVLKLVRKRVEDYRPRLEPLVGRMVEEMVGGALRASAGRHLLALVDDVRRDAERRSRRLLWVVGAVAAALLLGVGLVLGIQATRMQALRNRVGALEGGTAASTSAPAVPVAPPSAAAESAEPGRPSAPRSAPPTPFRRRYSTDSP
ncbi:MAG: hypothetical protein ACOCX4_07105 [Planctomycetota bacterium]